MDIISLNEASTANSRIEKINANPDSGSGIVTQPSVIASGDSVTIPTGRMAVLPNLQVDGELTIDGEVFIPSGASTSVIDEQLALKADQATTYTKTEVNGITDTKITLTEANSYDFGVGQTWQDVTASRSGGVTYTNTTGKPIMVTATNYRSASSQCVAIVGGLTISENYGALSTEGRFSTCVIVPDGSTYSFSLNGTLVRWYELR